MMQVIDENSLKSYLFGLTIDCPFKDSSGSCVFYKVRKLTIEEKFDWVESLPYEEAKWLYFEHLTCFYEKEQQLK